MTEIPMTETLILSSHPSPLGGEGKGEGLVDKTKIAETDI